MTDRLAIAARLVICSPVILAGVSLFATRCAVAWCARRVGIGMGWVGEEEFR